MASAEWTICHPQTLRLYIIYLGIEGLKLDLINGLLLYKLAAYDMCVHIRRGE